MCDLNDSSRSSLSLFCYSDREALYSFIFSRVFPLFYLLSLELVDSESTSFGLELGSLLSAPRFVCPSSKNEN